MRPIKNRLTKPIRPELLCTGSKHAPRDWHKTSEGGWQIYCRECEYGTDWPSKPDASTVIPDHETWDSRILARFRKRVRPSGQQATGLRRSRSREPRRN